MCSRTRLVCRFIGPLVSHTRTSRPRPSPWDAQGAGRMLHTSTTPCPGAKATTARSRLKPRLAARTLAGRTLWHPVAPLWSTRPSTMCPGPASPWPSSGETLASPPPSTRSPDLLPPSSETSSARERHGYELQCAIAASAMSGRSRCWAGLNRYPRSGHHILECGTAQQIQSYVKAWIYDTDGISSQPVIIQIVCNG